VGPGWLGRPGSRRLRTAVGSEGFSDARTPCPEDPGSAGHQRTKPGPGRRSRYHRSGTAAAVCRMGFGPCGPRDGHFPKESADGPHFARISAQDASCHFGRYCRWSCDEGQDAGKPEKQRKVGTVTDICTPQWAAVPRIQSNITNQPLHFMLSAVFQKGSAPESLLSSFVQRPGEFRRSKYGVPQIQNSKVWCSRNSRIP